MRKINIRRSVAKSVLAVAEGKSEILLLEHLKSIYITRGCGIRLKISGGFGKGAKGVVDYAISIQNGIDYDLKFAMIDTDCDWNPAVEKRAKEHNLHLFCSTPCLERWLLDIPIQQTKNLSTSECKTHFKRQFGGDAHEAGIIAKSFPRDLLEAAGAKSEKLAELIALVSGIHPNMSC